MENSLMAKNMDTLEVDCLMESYCIFSFIHLTNIYSPPGTRSIVVSKIFPQQRITHTRVHTHTRREVEERKYTFIWNIYC